MCTACAYTFRAREEEKAEAFGIAQSCFRSIMNDSDSTLPGTLTSAFSNFLLAIFRLVQRGEMRDQLADAVFREACKQGVVTKEILLNFH